MIKYCYKSMKFKELEIKKLVTKMKHYSKTEFTGFFLYPLKIPENHKIFDIFRGYRIRPVAWNELISIIPANIYLFKVSNTNARKRCKLCSELTTKIPERRHWRRSGVFILNFEHISHLFLVFPLLTLNMKILAGYCSLYHVKPERYMKWNNIFSYTL